MGTILPVINSMNSWYIVLPWLTDICKKNPRISSTSYVWIRGNICLIHGGEQCVVKQSCTGKIAGKAPMHVRYNVVE
jgi:hypothetical protein